MATKTTTTQTKTTSSIKTTHPHFPLKAQTQSQTTVTKPKRRKYRDSGDSSGEPSVVSSDTNTWCCPAAKHLPSPPPPPPSPPARPPRHHQNHPNPSAKTTPSFQSPPIRFSPGSLSPVMDFSNGNHHHHHETTPSSSSSFPTSFTKFNSVLTAGLLNPMSPPPAMSDKTRSSPTLFEMMASEPDIHHRPQIQSRNPNPNANGSFAVQDKQSLAMQRITDSLGSRSPGNLFNDAPSSDIKLTLSSREGVSVSMSVHRQILVAHSRFFAVKLSDRWARQQKAGNSSSPHIVEIADCEDVEVYIEALRLMYCKDLRKKLIREDVPRILGILKVSAAIGFDAGVLSCLEYLEAAPWAEDEEEKVASLLSELRLEGVGAGEVLKRVSVDVTNNGTEDGNDNEEVLLKLLHVVLDGKDEKARREMKGLVLKMLRENSAQNDLRKESLYSACEGCLTSLRRHFLRASESDLKDVGHIAREADNLHWILDILIDRQIGEDFLKTWASQTELAEAHSKVPAVHRFEVSRVTARLFVGIGKGQLLASKDIRGMLLHTWLVPFYDDFGWMRRATKGLDRHLIEEGLSNTILTLPLAWQQDILLSWFDRFLNSGEDCPNIQRGFEVWWRRAFWRRSSGEQERTRSLRITAATIENS